MQRKSGLQARDPLVALLPSESPPCVVVVVAVVVVAARSSPCLPLSLLCLPLSQLDAVLVEDWKGRGRGSRGGGGRWKRTVPKLHMAPCAANLQSDPP